MATVTIEEFNGTSRVQLDTAQTARLMRELRRVRGSWLSRFLTRLLGPKQRPFVTAPDLLVKIQNGARTTEYEVHDSYILHKKGEATSREFYMGLLLLEWLFGPTP